MSFDPQSSWSSFEESIFRPSRPLLKHDRPKGRTIGLTVFMVWIRSGKKSNLELRLAATKLKSQAHEGRLVFVAIEQLNTRHSLNFCP